ncbi:hypothetical protein BX265_6156 [Streptomyces sp. TLI_235]|nr:hypothetical protein [Streptomyces sp. TLI_235]PBC71546.1 hypothetical protein BX265_6156 [Streptomyces sp. TLI_235]
MTAVDLWWNFTTQTHEPLPCSIHALTSEQAARYVPQDTAVQRIFECHIGLGKTVPEALIATLSAVVGREPQP